jgi:hypothetical protein
MKSPQDWKLWQRVANAQTIANALKNIPAHWSLTSLRDKAAFRPNWQTEPFIKHDNFTTWLLDGEEKISSKGKNYRAYISGYGLRTGDSSNGLVAIDIDGASAEPVLEALSSGDLPETVSWTSGKPGRRQLLFQLPDELRQHLTEFNRSVLTEHNGVKTADGEQLELRYNNCQSVLPPSRHPQTGTYSWINSPSDCEVVIAPAWLCELLLKLANQEKEAEAARAREAEAARARAEVLRQQRQQQQPVFVGTPPLEIFLTRDDQHLINSGTGQGNRDDAGFKLAANLIATCDRLQAIGIPYEGDGERLFEEYGSRCSPPLSGRDINRIWKSASNKSKPSLNDEQLEKRFSYWQWEQKKTSFNSRSVAKSNNAATPIESISNLFKDFKHKLDNSFKGFGKQRVKPKLKPKPEAVKLNIPTPDEYQKLGHPNIIYDGGILHTWQEAKALGYKFVLDRSSTGQGKSYAAGVAIPTAFEVEKIFYLSADHRNPTTLPVEENYGDVSPRHNGFKLDESRLTPLGLPFKIHPQKDEKPDTPGNCFRTNLFHHLARKNLTGIEQSNESPICATCDLAGACMNGKGNGYGFRFERRQAFAYDRLRAHPDSMPNIDQGEYQKWMSIWDEAGRLVKSTKSLIVELSDFDKTWAELEAELPQHHQALTDLRRSLRPFLTGELKQPYYGWDDPGIRAALPQAPDDVLLLADQIEAALHPDLLSILKAPDSVDFKGDAGDGISKATRKLIRSGLREEARTKSVKNLSSLLLNWLPQFLRIWGGEKGAFRCQWDVLTIASRDEKHADIVKAFSFNVFLDATVDPDILALRLGIPRHELLVIEKSKPNYQNLRIVQVDGFGKLGKDRSNSIEQRVRLFQAWLRQKHSDIDFLDWLDYGDFAHFREGRGSNQFINHSALASFGTPYQNFGALQMEWQTLTGKSPEGEEFQAFVDAHVQEEIVQEVGRLRSHLSPEQEKTFYFVADYDLSFLASELPGVTIESVNVINLCPEAASEGNQTKWAILQALKELKEQSAKITSETVAAAAGISQPYISKIAKPFGGWKRLEKILLLLLKKLYSVSNIFTKPELELMDKPESELSDEEYKKLKELEAIKWMATQYLPIVFDDPRVDALAEVQTAVESLGWKAFGQIVGLMPIESKAKLLATLVNMLPSDVVEEFRRVIAIDGVQEEIA